MKFRKNDFIDCVGAVTILTEDRFLFQGQLKKGRHQKSDEDETEFVVLVLACEPALVRDNAQIQIISSPLFEIGDTIRINVDEIIAIGPSNGCLDTDTDSDSDTDTEA